VSAGKAIAYGVEAFYLLLVVGNSGFIGWR
jgi:hypothetical protein